MINSIKEIIELVNEKWKDYYIEDFLTGEDVKKLVNCITNLREENTNLSTENMILEKQKNRAEHIIDELEKYHIKSMENLKNTEDFKYIGINHVKILYEEHKRTLDKLKELKGDK